MNSGRGTTGRIIAFKEEHDDGILTAKSMRPQKQLWKRR
jgi:hypothetical protein